MLYRGPVRSRAEGRAWAIAWAHSITDHGYVVIDTETTGIGPEAEIVQIAVVGADEAIRFVSYCMPLTPIDENGRAFGIHGITNAMVAGAPRFPEAWSMARDAIGIDIRVAYNAQFDSVGVSQDLRRHRSTPDHCEWECAMLRYAEFAGVPGSRGDNKWHKLTEACRRENISLHGAHDAAQDAIATVRLVRTLAAQPADRRVRADEALQRYRALISAAMSGAPATAHSPQANLSLFPELTNEVAAAAEHLKYARDCAADPPDVSDAIRVLARAARER